jgi:2-dehydropantoate 2-reductase
MPSPWGLLVGSIISETMRIAIFGSGGVGGYFGGRLAAAGEDVTFLARGEHLAALRRGGLSIESPRGALSLPAVAAAERPEDVGPVDVVLFAVKLYDVDEAAAKLAPLLGPDTAVITTQNGVDAASMVSRHVPPESVVPGAAYIVATITAPGRIRHVVADRLLFGEPDGTRSRRLERFEAAARRAGLGAKLSEAIDVDVWTKFVRLATWAGMTAVTRSPMGVVRQDPSLLAMTMDAVREAIAVGEARGIRFAPSVVEETLELVHGFQYESRSSMLEDLEHGRRLELPWLSGAVVRLGEEARVPTPIHRFLATVLRPFVDGAR